MAAACQPLALSPGWVGQGLPNVLWTGAHFRWRLLSIWPSVTQQGPGAIPKGGRGPGQHTGRPGSCHRCLLLSRVPASLRTDTRGPRSSRRLGTKRLLCGKRSLNKMCHETKGDRPGPYPSVVICYLSLHPPPVPFLNWKPLPGWGLQPREQRAGLRDSPLWRGSLHTRPPLSRACGVPSCERGCRPLTAASVRCGTRWRGAGGVCEAGPALPRCRWCPLPCGSGEGPPGARQPFPGPTFVPS